MFYDPSFVQDARIYVKQTNEQDDEPGYGDHEKREEREMERKLKEEIRLLITR